MNTRRTPINDLGRGQQGQVFEPQTGRLSLPVPKHPRLDHLILSAADDLFGVPMLDRIFDRDARDRRFQNQPKKFSAFTHQFPALGVALSAFLVEPPRAAVCQVCAGRMRNHQIPSVAKVRNYITLDVLARRITWQQITRHRVMPQGAESVPHSSAKFTCNQNPQGSLPSVDDQRLPLEALGVNRISILHAARKAIVAEADDRIVERIDKDGTDLGAWILDQLATSRARRRNRRSHFSRLVRGGRIRLQLV